MPKAADTGYDLELAAAKYGNEAKELGELPLAGNADNVARYKRNALAQVTIAEELERCLPRGD